jgi:hypothetical protein
VLAKKPSTVFSKNYEVYIPNLDIEMKEAYLISLEHMILKAFVNMFQANQLKRRFIKQHSKKLKSTISSPFTATVS